MATNCEQRLNALKRRQSSRLSKMYEELSLDVSTALYKKNLLYQKSEAGQKIIAQRVAKFQERLYAHLQGEINEAFRLANICVDNKVREYIGDLTLSKEQKEVLFARNLSAVSSFMVRKTNGLNLSDRVWRVGSTAQTQINSIIEEGLLVGRSAKSSAKDLKRFLKEPDKRFRRVRDKETGKLVLSNPAKNYKTGRGVYKSSYKNALRLSRNEINIAYRTADMERYRRLPFVVGYKVQLSNSHPVYDICDELQGEYPKNFTFVGWHPNCLCFSTPIQISRSDFKKYLKTGKVPPSKYITQTPAGLGQWLEQNKDRVKGWKNTPYFIRDNFEATKDGFRLLAGIGELGTLAPAPLPTAPKPAPKQTPKKEPKQTPAKTQLPEFVPLKSSTEVRKYWKKLVEDAGRGAHPVGKVIIPRTISLDKQNERMRQLRNLFNEYKISEANSTQAITLSMKSGRSYLGQVAYRYEYSGKNKYVTQFNIGDRVGRERGKPRTGSQWSSHVDPENSEIATTTHEFAHFITVKKNTFFVKSQAYEKEFWDEIFELKKEYTKALRENANNLEWLKENFIGEYARKNWDEFFAESFTEYKLSSSPSPWAVKVGKLTDKYWKRKN